jgi:hypothetical protein
MDAALSAPRGLLFFLPFLLLLDLHAPDCFLLTFLPCLISCLSHSSYLIILLTPDLGRP